MLILHVNLKFKAKLRNMSAIVSFLDIELLYYCFYYQQEKTRVYSLMWMYRQLSKVVLVKEAIPKKTFKFPRITQVVESF